MFNRFCLLLLIVFGLHATPVNAAASESAPLQQQTQAELEQALAAIDKALLRGPQSIALAGRATLNLPSGYGFVPAQATRQLLNALGNKTDDTTLGMVVPLTEQFEWFMIVTDHGGGFIKDDDAASWDADELLESIREGTRQTNEQRAARGIPALEVVGWIEKPLYDQQSHQLVWSIEARSANQGEGGSGVNYNTLVLGRDGYISMNLVTDTERVESLKSVARELLSALNFDQGKRYADFNVDTDQVAEYGLAALVAGVAAKKLGLLAMLTAFLIKSWKVAALAVFGLGSALSKVFKRNPKA